jgi:hypothetical protein
VFSARRSSPCRRARAGAIKLAAEHPERVTHLALISLSVPLGAAPAPGKLWDVLDEYDGIQEVQRRVLATRLCGLPPLPGRARVPRAAFAQAN